MIINMKLKSFYIHTFGCQMNVYDSEQISNILLAKGYIEASSMQSADIIILNTCTIREKAQQKVYSLLGRISRYKSKNPDIIIAVGGCVAQQEEYKIQKKLPFVNIVFGTHSITKLPYLIEDITKLKKKKLIDTNFTNNIDDFEFPGIKYFKKNLIGFVTIMRGCNNYCSYCVVPYVRGREMSRKPEDIVNEIKTKVQNGLKEVILLGQNVNSYGLYESCSFADLLYKINKIEGLQRIRFTTSHPKDISNDLIKAYGEVEKLCDHIHLPVQSGSDKILKKMNRKYLRKDYLKHIELLRKVRKNISISSDFIVGFPGEDETDFNHSISLIKEVGYDSIFAFKYSDRSLAPSSKYSPKIDEKTKASRLELLLNIQSNITKKKYASLVNTNQKVLVEGMSKKRQGQWTGRTSGNIIVNFTGQDITYDITGEIVNVFINEACSHSLRGMHTT